MRRKRKRKVVTVFALILALVLVVTASIVGALAISRNASTPKEYEAIGSIDDYTEAVYTSPQTSPQSDAMQKIEAFAEANGLSVNEWPDELVELLERNPETEEFVLNYPLLKDSDPEIDISDSAYTDSVPLFLQWDKRWGYAPYGNDNIGIAGCGPTSLSMVYVYLTGDTSMNPKAMAEFSKEYGYCVPGNGSAWTLISEGGEILGLDVQELPPDEETVIYNLQMGNPVICIMGPGDFTLTGHFIVMTDYIDGKIKINDPNSVIRSEKLWNFEDIKDQIENLWACSTW